MGAASPRGGLGPFPPAVGPFLRRVSPFILQCMRTRDTTHFGSVRVTGAVSGCKNVWRALLFAHEDVPRSCSRAAPGPCTPCPHPLPPAVGGATFTSTTWASLLAFYKLWHNTHTMRFTQPAASKGAAQWHKVHSRCWEPSGFSVSPEHSPPHPPALAPTPCSRPLQLWAPGASQKWNHTRFALLCPAWVTEHDVQAVAAAGISFPRRAEQTPLRHGSALGPRAGFSRLSAAAGAKRLFYYYGTANRQQGR